MHHNKTQESEIKNNITATDVGKTFGNICNTAGEKRLNTKQITRSMEKNKVINQTTNETTTTTTALATTIDTIATNSIKTKVYDEIFESMNCSSLECDQCDQIDNKGYPESSDDEIHLSQKSVFLASNTSRYCGS